MNTAIVAPIIFALAVLMAMTGHGGGNFYVLVLVLAGLPMHEAATTGQFVLFCTASAAMLIFGRGKKISVPLALFLGSVTAGMAFFGGLAAGAFSGRELKMLFSALVALAGFAMLLKPEEKKMEPSTGFGRWNLRAGDDLYVINLWLAAPAAAATGFFSGMVGVSGGSFLVPLMVLVCGVPMRTAVGTASALVAATAAAGFTGHVLREGFNLTQALPVAAAAVLGGLLGGKITLRTKPSYLKLLFALTSLAAAVLMLINATVSK